LARQNHWTNLDSQAISISLEHNLHLFLSCSTVIVLVLPAAANDLMAEAIQLSVSFRVAIKWRL
jgi:hypothetical protein